MSQADRSENKRIFVSSRFTKRKPSRLRLYKDRNKVHLRIRMFSPFFCSFVYFFFKVPLVTPNCWANGLLQRELEADNNDVAKFTPFFYSYSKYHKWWHFLSHSFLPIVPLTKFPFLMSIRSSVCLSARWTSHFFLLLSICICTQYFERHFRQILLPKNCLFRVKHENFTNKYEFVVNFQNFCNLINFPWKFPMKRTPRPFEINFHCFFFHSNIKLSIFQNSLKKIKLWIVQISAIPSIPHETSLPSISEGISIFFFFVKT